MQFDIISYIEGIQRSLERLRPQGRIAFAVWCADALVRDVREYLAAKTDPAQLSAVEESLAYLWNCASGHKPTDTVICPLEKACAAVGWAEENVADNEQATNFYAIEAINSLMQALDTCRRGSAVSGAKAAESMINKLDRQLSDELVVDSYTDTIFSHPTMKAELERQQKMLSLLQNTPGLKGEHKTLFRS